MRTNLLALLGLLTACQSPDLATSTTASVDDQGATRPGDGDETDDAGGEDLGDTGDPMDDSDDIGQDEAPDEVIVGDPGGRVLRGGVVGSAWIGGQVVAISSDGSMVEATIGEDGAFAASLTRGMTWTLHLRAEGEPVITFHFQRNAGSTETTTRLTIPSADTDAPPPGAAPPTEDDTTDADDLNLGAVTPTESGATTESNPLEDVDTDGDGVSDYEDPDDDGDGVQDEFDSEPEVSAAALGLVVQKTYPALGCDNVDADDAIMVEFSLELDPASVQDSSLRLIGPDGAELPGMIEMSAADLFFQPAALMQPGEQYTVLVEGGLVATTGEALVGDQSWTFRVEAETDEAPLTLAIDEISPLAGEVVDADAMLSVEFNQAMAAASTYVGTGGFQVFGADGGELDGMLTVDDDRLEFEPYGGLEAGASYRMVVGMQLYSETGLGLARALQIGFSVAAVEHDDGEVDGEDDPTDDDGSTGDDGTSDDDDDTWHEDDGTIDDDDDDTWHEDDGTIDDDTWHEDDGTIDDDDGTTDDPHVGLTVLHVHPQDGQEVDAHTEMTVEFSEDLSASGVYQGLGGIQLIGPDGTEVEGQLWVDGQKLSFIPLNPLHASAPYRLVVGMQLLSVSGESLPEELQVAFTVAAASTDDGTHHDDTADDGTSHDDGTTGDDNAVAFTILGTHPQDGEQVDAWSELMIAFTQELAASTVYQGPGGVQLIGADGTEVSVEMWVEASQLRVKPLDGLVPGGTYTLMVGTQLYATSGEHLDTDVAIGFSVAPADSSHDDGTAHDDGTTDDGSKDEDGTSHDDGTAADGTAGDGTTHDDGTAADGTSHDDGTAADGTGHDGTAADGTGHDGTAADGTGHDDGTAADGTGHDGTAADGTGHDGTAADGTGHDDGTAADGTAADGTAADGTGHDDGTAADGTAADGTTPDDGTTHDDSTAADGTEG